MSRIKKEIDRTEAEKMLDEYEEQCSRYHSNDITYQQFEKFKQKITERIYNWLKKSSS